MEDDYKKITKHNLKMWVEGKKCEGKMSVTMGNKKMGEKQIIFEGCNDGVSYTGVDSFLRHVSGHNDEVKAAFLKYKCSIEGCNKQFATSLNLDAHRKSHARKDEKAKIETTKVPRKRKSETELSKNTKNKKSKIEPEKITDKHTSWWNFLLPSFLQSPESKHSIDTTYARTPLHGTGGISEPVEFLKPGAFKKIFKKDTGKRSKRKKRRSKSRSKKRKSRR